MAGLLVSFERNQQGGSLRPSGKFTTRLRRALGALARDMADDIEDRGRANIAGAGNFGSARWQTGFKARPWFRGAQVEVRVFSEVPYFRIFEYGGTIQGRPLLWIPLSFATDAQGVRARDYPGGLFRVDRKSGGAPLLLSRADRKPKYFGRESVRIPKKFSIRKICREVVATARERFNRIMRQTR